jgi:hypothetical protein
LWKGVLNFPGTEIGRSNRPVESRPLTRVAFYGVMSSWGGSIRLLASLAVTGFAKTTSSDVSLEPGRSPEAAEGAAVEGAEVDGAAEDGEECGAEADGTAADGAEAYEAVADGVE